MFKEKDLTHYPNTMRQPCIKYEVVLSYETNSFGNNCLPT